jgi:hypothetical protein
VLINKKMAKQKPKYSEAEMKKVGAGYDKIGFKNSAIDMVNSKMAAHANEWTGIVEEKYAPARPAMDTNVLRSRKPGWGEGDVMEDISKRNKNIKTVYEATGELTGKKGVSKPLYRENRETMKAYRADPTLDSKITATYEAPKKKK